MIDSLFGLIPKTLIPIVVLIIGFVIIAISLYLARKLAFLIGKKDNSKKNRT